MKKGILLLLLGCSVFANAQTLKEALFSGKLKNQSGTVIRKGDDLSAQIDTTTKVETTEAVTTTATVPAAESATNSQPVQTDSAALAVTDNAAGTETASNTTAAATTPEATIAPEAAIVPATAAAAPKSNNAIWKTYMDSVAGALKEEALSSKKVKRGSYYVMVSYTIETDGQVTVGDVFVSPENDYLQQQVKDRMSIDTPHLAPVLNSVGAPRKVTRKANFTITKE
jgi:hypothetical protein